jgi:D-alanyl-D-alanine carboxypeptidase
MWMLLACSRDPGPRLGHPTHDDPRHVDLQAALDEQVLANNGYGGGIASVHAPGEGTLDLVVSGNAVRGGPPMAPDSTFEVASVTKTFTATSILLLDEQGALSIDRPAADYVPDLMTGFEYGSQITIRELLNQTSGLPDYWNDPPFVHGHQNAFLVAFIAKPNRVWAPEELVGYAADLRTIGSPGRIWHYADTNYVLLGRILEVVRGQELQDVYRDLLFDPLGLETMYLTYHEDAPTDRVEAHRYEGHDDLYQVPRQSADWAGGGLVSSTDDLSTFIEALATGKVLDDAHLGEMTTWVDTEYGPDEKYGMGLFWYDLGPAGQIWGHDGYGNAWMYWWPEQRLSLTGSLDQTYDYDTWLPIVKDAFAQIAPQ